MGTQGYSMVTNKSGLAKALGNNGSRSYKPQIKQAHRWNDTAYIGVHKNTHKQTFGVVIQEKKSMKSLRSSYMKLLTRTALNFLATD